MVEGRRQDLHFAGRQHLLEPGQQAARGEIGHQLGERPAARGARRACPSRRASQSSQVRTVERGVDREDADRRRQCPLVRDVRPLDPFGFCRSSTTVVRASA